jgi:multiple antibiotic resistance protein
MMDASSFAKTLVALVAIVNPIGAVPTFLAITDGLARNERRHMAWLAALTVGCLLGGAVIAGDAVLRMFGVSMSAFRVAGGILLLLMAIAMLHGETTGAGRGAGDEEAASGPDRKEVAVVPLALPLLAGPGSLSTMVLYANLHPGFADKLLLIAVGILVAVAVWLTLRAAGPIGARLGRTGILVFTRLMGLFLAAIAVEFIMAGLTELLPGLAKA